MKMKNKFIITIDTPTILKIANKTWKEINFFYQNATSFACKKKGSSFIFYFSDKILFVFYNILFFNKVL